MKQVLLTILLITVLVGCNNNNVIEPTTPTQDPTVNLTAEEQIAFDYIHIYLNGNDNEAKNKYVDTSVHEEVKMIFNVSPTSDTSSKTQYSNPRVIESVSYTGAGKDSTLILISSDDDMEVIVMMVDGKLYWGYESNETADDKKEAFLRMKAEFN